MFKYLRIKQYLALGIKQFINRCFFFFSVQSKPSFETCDTRTLVLGGKMVMSKTIGNTTACQNQNDYYGNFQPDQHHFNVLVRFSVDTSTFPLKKPTYIDSFNFGITDFTVEIISRRIGGK